ncbi:MAG TPA: GNAT family protein, partial [Actinotalea sp.]
HQGVLVGLQGASTHDYPVLREAETGSWLGRQYQGRGIGTRMRVLMLHLLFDGLGAQSATTSAFEDNPASLAVTRTLGYADDGTQLQVREGVPARHHRFRMDRAVWEARPGRFRPDVAMSGVEELAVFLGVGD